MKRLSRNIILAIFLFLFAAQSVFACVCEVNNSEVIDHASMGHDLQKNSNSHHGDTHDCAAQCHLSFNELDSGDFIASKNQDVKTPKYESPPIHKEHFYLQEINP
ncbi:MAG: hypothetical protein P8J14_06395, partial [Emcibacteraceae bacterium]|nr:hypothetical protein [Emcibacteraceae bacterium]